MLLPMENIALNWPGPLVYYWSSDFKSICK